MSNINFVPDDYVQSNESQRTNLMYLVLFLVVMVTLGGSFMIITVRQRALSTKEKIITAKMARAEQTIKQFEELQIKRKAMMKTALTTAELLEPIPRSILLASLTNNLPAGTSLLQLNLIQKAPKINRSATTTSKYKQEQEKKAASEPKTSPEKLLETHIDIEGVAPSDLQVATYIEKLGSSILLDNVALVESKEYKMTGGKMRAGTPEDSDITFRQFKLKAMLKKNVHLTKDDINQVRAAHSKSVRNF
jgi:Tfp pilus assembly protein PilN